MEKKTIAFDFDGVIHRYSLGWHNGEIYDSIWEGWFGIVQQLLKDGFTVFIMSTRPKRQIYKYFKNKYFDPCDDIPCLPIWTCKFGFRVMPFWEKFVKNKYSYGYKTVGICNHKAVFDVLVDDRAICFDGNNSEGLLDKIINFKSWVSA